MDINLRNDTFFYTLNYSTLIVRYLNGDTPRFIFDLDGITVIVSSEILAQFKIQDSVLFDMFNSKFNYQWSYYKKYKLPIIMNITDIPSTTLLYSRGCFIRKYLHYGPWMDPEIVLK